MPQRPAHPCAAPGCPRLARGSARCCPAHARGAQAQYDQQRGSAAQRGYGGVWRRLRKQYLSRHPQCVDPFGEHARAGALAPASQVDHIQPLRAGGSNTEENFQALCASCHSRKTVAMDGGYGGQKADAASKETARAVPREKNSQCGESG